MKSRKGQTETTVRERLGVLLRQWSPWPDEPLTYERFGEIIGANKATVTNWMKRGSLSKDGAAQIAAAARRTGWRGVTVDWLLRGAGPGPQKGVDLTPGGLASARSGREAAPGGPLAAGEPVVQYGRRREPTPDELYLEWAMGAARNLAQTEADGVKPIALLALVDIVEEIGLAQGFDPARVRRHTRQLRRDIRERHGLRDEDDRSSA